MEDSTVCPRISITDLGKYPFISIQIGDVLIVVPASNIVIRGTTFGDLPDKLDESEVQ